MSIDRRALYRRGLHEIYLPRYDALCAALSGDWQPTRGLSSFEVQDQLYAQGRTAPGKIVTKAPGGLSFHNYGLASDWDFFPGGKYAPLEFEDSRWQEYLDACNKVGLRCITWEKPHNEFPARASIRDFYEAWKAGTILNLLLQESSHADDQKPVSQ